MTDIVRCAPSNRSATAITPGVRKKTCAAPRLASAPPCTATPTCARDSAAASLTPSPTMMAGPADRSITCSLSSGRAIAHTCSRSMPKRRATTSTTSAESPLRMPTWCPRARSAASASGASVRSSSPMAKVCATCPSTPRYTVDQASPAQRAACSSAHAGTDTCSSAIKRREPSTTLRPPTLARTPAPSTCETSSALPSTSS